MWSLQYCITIVILNIVALLPSATHCDTSYYEKYYSARRYQPPKKQSFYLYTFTVDLGNSETLQAYEQLAVTGDHKILGGWSAQGALLLNRTEEHNVWSGEVNLPPNTTLQYRYFVATVHPTSGLRQVRRWESYIQPRTFQTSAASGSRLDTFGIIAPEVSNTAEITRGWLNVGRIVQLKVFRKPLDIEEKLLENSTQQQLHLKLQPVDRVSLTPILPGARVNIEYVSMTYGNSYLRAQSEFGATYKENDILIFHITLGDVGDMQDIAFSLKLFASEAESGAIRLLGYQHIYTEVLEGSEGAFELKLISPVWLNTIARLSLEYLVITPLPGPPTSPVADFHTTFVHYWRDNWKQLDIGHRGMGKSFSQPSTYAPPATENTLASMKTAATLGADMVEFDVQLTSDLVPVIYHDYVIYVCLSSKTPTSRDDLTKVYIKDLTYDQLKNLKTYQVVGSKIVEYPAHNNVVSEDQRLFPLFEDFLTKINKTTGFDIEIKWPQLLRTGSAESEQTIDKNIYVDRILAVMLRHGCGRFSFFSTFDADITTLLRFKQNMYPVYLLQASLPIYTDPRTHSIYNTLNNAQAFDLAGIIPNAAWLQLQPNAIELANKVHKKFFIWGDALKDDESIAKFKEQQPTGLIYDRLDLWLPLDKKSAFDVPSDLPEFFDLQCAPTVLGGGGTNETAESILSNVTFW